MSNDDKPNMGPFKHGDRVRVRPEFRSKYEEGPARRGEILTVTGPNYAAVGIGPGAGDWARHWELEAAS